MKYGNGSNARQADYESFDLRVKQLSTRLVYVQQTPFSTLISAPLINQ